MCIQTHRWLRHTYIHMCAYPLSIFNLPAEKCMHLSLMCCIVLILLFSCRLRPTNRNVLSTWSSGTGGAGIIGAFSYAALIAVGLTEKITLISMTSVPILQLLIYCFLLRAPTSVATYASTANGAIDISLQGPTESLRKKSLTSMKLESEQMNKLAECELPLEGIKDKLKYMPSLFKYIVPLVLVFLCEYLINSGLVIIFRLYFDYVFLSHCTLPAVID